MSKNYSKAADEILEVLGGKDNIISAAHCATRLRLVLKDEELVELKRLEYLRPYESVVYKYKIML